MTSTFIEKLTTNGVSGAKMPSTTYYIPRREYDFFAQHLSDNYLVTRDGQGWKIGGFRVPEQEVSFFHNSWTGQVDINAAKMWLDHHRDAERFELFLKDKKFVPQHTWKRPTLAGKVLAAWLEYLADKPLLKSVIGMTHEEIHEYIHCVLQGFPKHEVNGFYPKSTDKKAQYLLSTSNREIGEIWPSQEELDWAVAAHVSKF